MHQPDDLLLFEEVAALCRTSVTSVRIYIKTGRLNSIKPARRRLIRFADLQALLRSEWPQEGSAAAPEVTR